MQEPRSETKSAPSYLNNIPELLADRLSLRRSYAQDKLNANSNLAERASSIAALLLGLGLFATCVVGCDRARRKAAPPPLADASVSASGASPRAIRSSAPIHRSGSRDVLHRSIRLSRSRATSAKNQILGLSPKRYEPN